MTLAHVSALFLTNHTSREVLAALRALPRYVLPYRLPLPMKEELAILAVSLYNHAMDIGQCDITVGGYSGDDRPVGTGLLPHRKKLHSIIIDPKQQLYLPLPVTFIDATLLGIDGPSSMEVWILGRLLRDGGRPIIVTRQESA